jgi:hypothetical protein
VSRIAGSTAAITAVQENPVHYLQRADDYRLDSARTSLVGDQEELAVGKYGGPLFFELAYERQSRGFEANDLGYLQRADQQIFQAWIGYRDRIPRGVYQTWWANLNQWDMWNAAGMRTQTAVNANAHMILINNWQINSGASLTQLGGPLCDHCARGGPAMRSDPGLAPFVDIVGDARRAFVPELYVPMSFGDGGRSRSVSINPSVSVRVRPQLQVSGGLAVGVNRAATQWLGNFADSGATKYSFARLTQRTRSFTFRGSYAATPRVSLETYVAPFASDASYSDVRALSATPDAAAYADRFVSFVPPAAAASSFDIRQLRATTVLRWEYSPGSALFVVWSGDNGVGSTFTVKASYRVAR